MPVELLSLDSMKVYRGLDRGTDKLAPSRFALTSFVDPRARFSTGDFVRAAVAAVAAIRARGRVPLFVGGTGLYLRALLRGLSEVPPIAPELRAAVAGELDRDGAPAGHAALARLDPATAARLHPNDRKRIARALEVVRATGRPLSEWQKQETRCPIAGRAVVVGIRWSRAALRRRLVERIDRMFADGLVDEVRALLAADALGPVAGEAIGYREVVEMVRVGGTLAGCRERVIADTATFVRRQDNWFRQFPEIRWIDADDAPGTVPERVVAALRDGLGGSVTAGWDRPSRS